MDGRRFTVLKAHVRKPNVVNSTMAKRQVGKASKADTIICIR